jgi:hypothetical protein
VCAEGGRQALLPAHRRRSFPALPLGSLWAGPQRSSVASIGALSRAASHDTARATSLPVPRARTACHA